VRYSRPMKAPAGAEVGLYVDLVAQVATGDVIETQTGRRYLVTSRREQMRGKHTGWLHRIRWYPRGRGKRVRR
jgi:hypothetical protein